MFPGLLSGLFGILQGRIDHVPERDIPEVVATVNSMRDPSLPQLTEQDWRAFESTQVLYTTGRIIRQATPRPAQPVVQAALGGALPGLASKPLPLQGVAPDPPAGPS